jgi:WD40 repeat protein
MRSRVRTAIRFPSSQTENVSNRHLTGIIARVWDVATGLAISPPLAHDGPVNWVEFQGDDSRLLSASDDGTIRIWNAADGKPSGDRLISHGSRVRLARFNPDGKHIVSAGHGE